MSIASDALLSTAAQQQIKNLTAQLQAGKISLVNANAQANAIRASEGSAYTADTKGNTLYTPTQTSSFEDYLKNSGYSDYENQVKQAVQATVDKAVNGYTDQIDTTNTDSAELARQAYITKMLGQKNLNQQLSAAGYSGGAADSQKIQTETNYQNNLTSIETQRQNTVKELQSAIQDAQLTGDLQGAQDLATQLSTLQSQWSDYKTTQQSLSASASDTAYTKAMNLLAKGIMPDNAMLSSAGISSINALAIQRYYLNQGGTGTTGTTAAASTKSTAASSSTAAGGSSAVSTGSTSTGMNDSYFTAFAKSIAAQLAAGKADAAQSNIDSNWDSLSTAQKQQITALVAKYGY